MTTPARQANVIERLRSIITDPTTREVSMFGGRSFMVNDQLVASALRSGDLLVRVDPGDHDEMLSEHGATAAEMGKGRSMGPGWINVSAEAITSRKQLSIWVRRALDRNTETGASR